jgi:hypothetical protein
VSVAYSEHSSFSELRAFVGALRPKKIWPTVHVQDKAAREHMRSLTVYLVRHETLRAMPYLPHGAHWAIGTLGIFLLVGIERQPPEWLTGGISVAIVAAAWASSLAARRHEERSREPA